MVIFFFIFSETGSDLEAIVVSEAWPCPEVSVHTCYTHTPGHHWPPGPEEKGANRATFELHIFQHWICYDHVLLKRICSCSYLCDFILTPKAGVVKWCVSMFVKCIRISFALDQLEIEEYKVKE